MNCLGDDLVLGLVEGRLPPATLSEVDEHIDSCTSCRDVVSLVAGARPPGRTLAKGDRVGRFVIGELLGTGAMGRVYAAFEPELDRRVAIKMLIEDDGAGRERLIKEAQAMARLNHPNVVTVHEVATTDAGVFVAMELVEGESLRSWVESRRPWREVVRVLTEIARGLAAVHAAGVVHRDLKPDNVIVGADGRVRLGDFGLARAGAKPDGTALAIGTDTTVAGTPAYMAPEVLRGGPASAATDQFSFGVLAHELLAGTRPFSGTTWAELLAAIERGDVPPLRDVPGWLDAAVRRCLAVDVTERFPSMQAVAGGLSRYVAKPRRAAWIAAACATAVLGSAATYLVLRRNSEQAALCDSTLPQLRVADARVAPLIDRWSREWRVERVAACRASELPRARCLDGRRDELVALVEAIDAKTSSRLLDAVAALPPPAECRAAMRDSADPIPLDPLKADRIAQIHRDARVIRTDIALDRLRGSGPQDWVYPAIEATALVERARAEGHLPTLAEMLLLAADVSRADDMFKTAALFARDATAEAVRGHADLIGAQAWLTRLAIAGSHRDLESAEDVEGLAQAAVERVGSPPHMAASLARLRGLLAYNQGNLDVARKHLVAAREGFVQLSGERSLDVAAVESGLGSVERAAGNLDLAMRHHETAYSIDLELRGERHRDIARDLHNIAGVLRLRGDLPGALTKYREALALEIALQGERSAAAGVTRNSIGLVLMAQQNWEQAREELTRARDALHTKSHGDMGFAEHNLGLVAQAQGDHRTALAHFDRAAQIYAETIGDKPESVQRLADDRQRSTVALNPGAPAPLEVVPPPAGSSQTTGSKATTASNRPTASNAPLASNTGTGSNPPTGSNTTTESNTTTGSNTPTGSNTATGANAEAAKEPVKVPAPPTDVPRPTEPKPPEPPKKPRDIGVYGSQQPW